MTENERFGLVFEKTWSINSGTGHYECALLYTNARYFSRGMFPKGIY
jgi:hypothetical protein